MGKQTSRNQLVIYTSAFFCIALLVGSTPPELPGKPKQPQVSTSENLAPAESENGVYTRDERGRVAADDERQDNLPWQAVSNQIASPTSIFKKQATKRPGLEPREFIAVDNNTYPLRTYQALTIPNDPYADQSWVTNSNISDAWSATPGNYRTSLAIIDTGFALNHEEFQDRWHQNKDETGATSSESPSIRNCTDRGLPLDYSCNLVDDNVDGTVDNETGAAPYENTSKLNCTDRGLPLDKSCNLIDDDMNDYVDDVRGWDMVNQDNSPQAGELNPSGSGTMHGTMVAGVAAATGGNGKGIAGADWRTKILPIQALDDDSYGDTFTVGKAIYYAVEQNVDVINISLGGEYDDPYVRQAIEAATAAGILVVASSGNDGCDCVAYPARYSEVLAVGATDQSNAIASFSSWGTSVDIVAPGTGYTVPAWSQAYQTNGYATGVDGTSFSSPLVAGMATSLKSHQPSAAPLHLIAALRQTSARTNIPATTIQDSKYGYGRVDGSSATQRMTVPQQSMLLYGLSPVQAGNYFDDVPLEKDVGYRVVDCQSSRSNIRIYEPIKGTERFYSISEVERRKAESLGFNTQVFANACLRQPHDTANSLRLINIFREFRNLEPLKL